LSDFGMGFMVCIRASFARRIRGAPRQ